MVFMPESPRWLSKVGKEDISRGILHRIYLPEFLEEAVQYLAQEVEELKKETQLTEKERLASLFTTYRKCIIIGCSL
jgi:SP family myo-inositol transporter-like MFS transporter 13